MINLSLNSVHLSPEELAAIDHGLMSVYGNSNNRDNRDNRDRDNHTNQIFKENHNTNNNNIFGFNNTKTPGSTPYNNPLNTPTPTPLDDGMKPSSLFSQNINVQPTQQYNSNPSNPSSNANHYSNPSNPGNYYTPNTPYTTNTPYTNTFTPVPQYDNLMKTYEDRIESILKSEREKYERMETNYRSQLEQLKRSEFGYSEKLKLEQIIQDLRRQIESLEDQLKSSRSNQMPSDQKIDALKFHYDRKIANLVNQFEQEKASALEIMKTRAKAEINLLIPKLKTQLQANLERSQAEAVNRIKQQAASYIQKLKQDFQMERQVLIEHLKRKQMEEISKIKDQLQLKFEAKLLEEKKKLAYGRYNNNSNNGYNAHTGYGNNAHNSYVNPSYNNTQSEKPWKTPSRSNSKPFSSIFNAEPSFLL